jgi:hypothetical protein
MPRNADVSKALRESRVPRVYREIAVDRILTDLHEQTGVAFVIRDKGVGTAVETRRVTVATKGLRASAVLDRALQEAGLAWVIQEGAVVITAPDLLRRGPVERRSHDVSELLVDTKAADLRRFVVATVAPNSWSGVCTATFRGHFLVVNHRRDVQREVEELLQALRGEAGRIVGMQFQFMEVMPDDLAAAGIRLRLAPALADNDIETDPDADAGIAQAILGPFEGDAFLRALGRCKSLRRHQTPVIAGQEGRYVHVAAGRALQLVTDVDLVMSEGGVGVDPALTAVRGGMSLEVRPQLSLEGRYVTLDIRVTRERFLRGGTRTQKARVASIGHDLSDLRFPLRDTDGDNLPDVGELWCADVDGDGKLSGADGQDPTWCFKIPPRRGIEFPLQACARDVHRLHTRVSMPNGSVVLIRGLTTVVGEDALREGDGPAPVSLLLVRARARFTPSRPRR